ncbi:uncharacterized protein LOC121774067 [Salvia splendens]|uniref:uncharacterized protein LOC121774067 n=1 Tax=Salvia splendens TaxID=180675 RepID=UPI001C2585E6|nr:uncharacterized protein LOC121774067 [Salvia splendens]
MYGTISVEKTVDVPATEAWKLHSTLQIPKLVKEALPDLISRIDVVKGAVPEPFSMDGRGMEVVQREIHGGGSREACEGGRSRGRWISGFRVHAVSCEIRSDRGGGKREAMYNSTWDRVRAQRGSCIEFCARCRSTTHHHDATLCSVFAPQQWQLI